LDEAREHARGLLAAAAEALALRAHVGARVHGRERDAAEALGVILVRGPDALQDGDRVLAPVLEAGIARRGVAQPGELADQVLQPQRGARDGFGGAQERLSWQALADARALPVREAFLVPGVGFVV